MTGPGLEIGLLFFIVVLVCFFEKKLNNVWSESLNLIYLHMS